jgi:hypothetical protein
MAPHHLFFGFVSEDRSSGGFLSLGINIGQDLGAFLLEIWAPSSPSRDTATGISSSGGFLSSARCVHGRGAAARVGRG